MLELAKFKVRQRLNHFSVPDQPHFDQEGAEYFAPRLRRSSSYLEYGAGGSTVEAARLGINFVTVESDRFFLDSVKRKILGAPTGTLIYANVGITGPWGVPVIQRPTAARVRRWASYPEAPWAHDASFTPDLILVDGRFRALCALTVFERLQGKDYELLFDDYLDRRSHFEAIEKFGALKCFVGRMAIFGPSSFKQTEMNQAKLRFAADFH